VEILVDSNVLIDIVTEDETWFRWSAETLAAYADTHILLVNTVIYAELSVGFNAIEEVEDLLSPSYFRKVPVPWEAAFLAGKCFLEYRKRGGRKRSPLPDFFIGAHASILGIPLMTRDVSRYRTNYPKLELVAPKSVRRRV